ncbi:MAG: nitroreductase family protein [Thiobacillaceae bacterium]
MRSIEQILNLARWAPSGDNTQPWRFEVVDDDNVVVHGFDTRDHCVYDLDGHPSQLAVGALLETISLAATAYGRRARITRRRDTPETDLLFDVQFEQDPDIKPDPLVDFIEKRMVQRRAMSTRPIKPEEKAKLSKALGDAYEVVWFESLGKRWRMAKLCFDNAKIRLTIPEAYEVHRVVIEWGARYSEDKIPDQAVGADAFNLQMMRWAMVSWERVHFFNTWLLGHLMPRLQMDLVPGILCAGHFALLADKPVETVDDYINAGRAMQRFWLTAASLGLYIQPEMTPLIFARYHRQKINFTRVKAASDMADGLDTRLRDMFSGGDINALFFVGRIGTGPAPTARSTRKPLETLILAGDKLRVT